MMSRKTFERPARPAQKAQARAEVAAIQYRGGMVDRIHDFLEEGEHEHRLTISPKTLTLALLVGDELLVAEATDWIVEDGDGTVTILTNDQFQDYQEVQESE